MVRTGIVMILKACPDFEVVAEARDGEEAIELFRQHRPDLLLLDLRMPKIDGAGVIERLRADDAHARVIVLTTYDSAQDVHRAIEAGASRAHGTRSWWKRFATSFRDGCDGCLPSYWTGRLRSRHVPS
jgi:DNA-binding NarL/FixJ family response regulator